MSKVEKDAYLSSMYFDTSKLGSYGGLKRFWNAIKRDGKLKFTRAELEQWLSSQDGYSLQKPIRYKFKRSRIITTGIDNMWDMDLAEFQQIASSNDGVRYLLIVIDIFSRYLFVRPLKTKSAIDVTEAVMSVFADGRKPKKLRSDQGAEFNNARMKRSTVEVGVRHFHTQNEVKANYAERVIRTLKNVIYRLINSTNSNRYIDELPNLVFNYNHSAHRSLHERTPASVNKTNEVAVWREMYFEKPSTKQKSTVKKFGFRVGDTVRIAATRRVFSKDSHHRWTREIFVITHRYRFQNIPLYRLNDMTKESIQGTFYANELQRVTKDEQSVYHIERVIKRIRVKGGGYQYLVRWLGWPAKFDSVVPASEIQTLGTSGSDFTAVRRTKTKHKR
jgi:transposase InsO family protein